jgi:hypothetical protein
MDKQVMTGQFIKNSHKVKGVKVQKCHHGKYQFGAFLGT